MCVSRVYVVFCSIDKWFGFIDTKTGNSEDGRRINSGKIRD